MASFWKKSVRFAVTLSDAMKIEADSPGSSKNPPPSLTTFDVSPDAVRVTSELVNILEPSEPVAVTDSVNVIRLAERLVLAKPRRRSTAANFIFRYLDIRYKIT